MKAKAAPKFSTGDIQAISEDLARDIMVLYPDLALPALVEKMEETAPPEFMVELDRVLHVAHFGKALRIVRRKDRPVPAPLFQYAPIQEAAARLPKKLKRKSGKFVPREQYNFEDLKRILAARKAELREKSAAVQKGDPIIVSTEALIAEWPARTKRTQGITLLEVDALKASKKK